ncbi:hypothetical protein F5Y19DRAFT_464500 [Xylariaceae sp. FL1651]|nr:hypothetical protein F5Y19DRAFT_464500 [Xylariaceae sp. FL1651]
MRISVEQELFTTSIYSPGSPILLPNGARIFNRLVEFLRKQYVRYGFDEVITPTIYKKALWKKSGHLENYSDDMFTVTSTSPSRGEATEGGEEDEYGLKPMNCPGHCLIFASQRRSYRDLPIRYADFSPLHRNEISGALSGLTRVRRFHQDDGHIFCRPSQIEEEIRKTLDFVRVVYSAFRLGPYRLALSTQPADHYIGTAEEWGTAEGALKRALDTSGLDWTVNEGDGAFYGPKIDIILRDSDGKEHQTATIQLDFQLPKRFELGYLAPAPEFERQGKTTTDPAKLEESGLVTPVLIHRAVLGSVERLMALLIEHYNGKWPFWLNPRQVMIVTVNDSQPVVEHAKIAQDVLLGRLESTDKPVAKTTHFAVDIDDSRRSVGLKIREAKSKGYSVIVTIGPQQLHGGTVTCDLSALDSGGEAPLSGRVEMSPADLVEILNRDLPSDPPPAYAAAAQEHGLPIRQPQQAPQQGRRPPPLGVLELPILNYMRTHRVILASASPRRRALLAQVGLPNLEVMPSTKLENLPKDQMGAFEYVSSTAQQKALDVYQLAIKQVEEAAEAAETAKTNGEAGEATRDGRDDQPAKGLKDPDLIIAADTVIVTRDGAILEKPPSEQAHRRMLRHLRDTRSHRVLTAVCCIAPKADASFPGYTMASHIEETRVTFAKASEGLPDEVIDAYVRTREGVDKAGGYAVQGIGGMMLVEKIEGSLDSVIGLPIRKCLQLCEKVIFKQDEESEGEEED